MIQQLTHGSLFSGIGGFELGAELAGIPTLWNCEIEPFQRRILKKNFPLTLQYEDIRTVQSPWPVNIISGGFPCQDISIAGKGAGITASRSGLWSEMFRVVGEVRPDYIIIENSPMLTIRGLERVLCNLSEIGYNAEWQCLSGFTFGIQQGRERIYIIAYPDKVKQEWGTEESVFRQLNIQGEFKRVFPGWRERRDIPEPRTLRTSNELPYRMDRTGAIGNAVIPLIAFYLFECIKKHYYGNTTD